MLGPPQHVELSAFNVDFYQSDAALVLIDEIVHTDDTHSEANLARDTEMSLARIRSTFLVNRDHECSLA